MRVIFPHDFTHDMSTFFGWFINRIACFPHGKNNTTLNRFQTISSIRNRTVLNYVFGVDVKTIPHQVIQGGWYEVFCDFRSFVLPFFRHYFLTSLMNVSSSLKETFSSIQARRWEGSFPMRILMRFSTTKGSSIVTLYNLRVALFMVVL